MWEGMIVLEGKVLEGFVCWKGTCLYADTFSAVKLLLSKRFLGFGNVSWCCSCVRR